jgi:hypothetical protein
MIGLRQSVSSYVILNFALIAIRLWKRRFLTGILLVFEKRESVLTEPGEGTEAGDKTKRIFREEQNLGVSSVSKLADET